MNLYKLTCSAIEQFIQMSNFKRNTHYNKIHLLISNNYVNKKNNIVYRNKIYHQIYLF